MKTRLALEAIMEKFLEVTGVELDYSSKEVNRAFSEEITKVKNGLSKVEDSVKSLANLTGTPPKRTEQEDVDFIPALSPRQARAFTAHWV